VWVDTFSELQGSDKMNVMTSGRFANCVLLAVALVALGAACSGATEPTAVPDDPGPTNSISA